MIETVAFLFYHFFFILLPTTPTPSTIISNQTMEVTNGTEFRNFGNLSIMARSEWEAREPKEIQQLAHPVPKVIIHHSLMGGNNCTNLADEVALVKKIQDFHMDDAARKWSDIGYSFLVGQSGTIFEGRGWNRIGAHSYGNNAVSVGICLLGDFTERLPTTVQIEATQNLIGFGVREGFISEEYRLLGHRDVRKGTECPGSAFYTELLSNWPHKGVANQDEIF